MEDLEEVETKRVQYIHGERVGWVGERLYVAYWEKWRQGRVRGERAACDSLLVFQSLRHRSTREPLV